MIKAGMTSNETAQERGNGFSRFPQESNGGIVRADTPLGAVIASPDDEEFVIYLDLRRPDFDQDLELGYIEFSAENAGSPDERLYIDFYIYNDAAKGSGAVQAVRRKIEKCFCTGGGIRLERLFHAVRIRAGDDPKHPGVYIDLQYPDDGRNMPLNLAGQDLPLVLVEFSADDADNPNGEPRIAAYVWGDSAREDYTTRVVYQNIEEYFRLEDLSEFQSESQFSCCRREYIDEPFILDRQNFDSGEWAVYCKLAGGLPPDRTKRIVFHVDRIDSWNE